jgi:hypothetical protein
MHIKYLNADEHAVVVGMSAPGTPGDPHFAIEIGKVFHYTEDSPFKDSDHQRRIYDRGFCVPRGIHAGWVCIKDSVLPENSRLELQVVGDAVKLRLLDMHLRHIIKENSVSASEITNRGFDLRNIEDNHGQILPQQLAQYLAELVF